MTVPVALRVSQCTGAPSEGSCSSAVRGACEPDKQLSQGCSGPSLQLEPRAVATPISFRFSRYSCCGAHRHGECFCSRVRSPRADSQMPLHLRISKCLTQLRPQPTVRGRRSGAWGGGPPKEVSAAAAVEGWGRLHSENHFSKVFAKIHCPRLPRASIPLGNYPANFWNNIGPRK